MSENFEAKLDKLSLPVQKKMAAALSILGAAKAFKDNDIDSNQFVDVISTSLSYLSGTAFVDSAIKVVTYLAKAGPDKVPLELYKMTTSIEKAEREVKRVLEKLILLNEMVEKASASTNQGTAAQ